MNETAEMSETHPNSSSFVEKISQSLRKPSTWILILIIVLALVTRLPSLDDRVMSHDEINHVYFAWLFTENGTYQHDPLSHGPFQFHVLAASFFAFGDSDASARFPVAFAGIAAIVLIFAFRRWLGTTGALAAGLMMVFSPYMLFYSRYTRNEIFVVLEALLMVWAVFRYLEDRRSAWLYLLAISLALHATTKETFFLYTAQLLLYLGVVFSAQILKISWPKPHMKMWFSIGLALTTLGLGSALLLFLRDRTDAGEAAIPFASPLVFIAAAFGLIGLVILIVSLIRAFGHKLRTDFPILDVIIVAMTLTLPQLAAVPAQAMGWDPLGYQDPTDLRRTAVLVVLLILVSVGIGLAWDWRRWLKIAGLFLLIYIPLYTTFFTNPFGLFSGLVGSLGYWLVQQGVERGSQPWFYYTLLQIPFYEFLPALGALVGGIYALWRIIRREDLSPSSSSPSKETVRGISGQTLFVVYLIYWSFSALFIFTFAGEKMPWLTVHIALPIILLSGWVIGMVFEDFNFRSILNWRALLLIVLSLVAIAAFSRALSHILGFIPLTTTSFAGVERAMGWLLAALLAGVSFYAAIRLARGFSTAQLTRLALFTVLSLIFLQTIRTAIRASFVKFDSAEEFLVYAHAAAGPKYAKEQLDILSIQLTGGDEIRVAYDNHAAYPYWWYLRRYPNAQDVGATPGRELLEYPVVFAGEENYAKFEAFLGDDYSSLVYERMWWPIQDYFNLSWESIKNALIDPEMRNALWKIWFDRDYRTYARLKGEDLSPRGWQPASKMKMYVHNDLAGAIPGMGYEEPTFEPASFADPYLNSIVELAPEQIIGGSGAEPGLFSSPRGLALGAGGTIYVADSQNHRIQVLDEDGQVLNTWGTFSDAISGDASEGAFNQPWDVATGPDHEIVVADTWNHRVQLFDENGEFISSFGTHGIGAGIDALWGPRSAAVDREGRIYISDTGNKRIVVFDPSGSTLSEIGMGGVGLGQLDEPVGLAMDEDGRLYVADTWNMRIQIFEETIPGTFEAVAEWPVDAWYGQSLENKPYIAVSPEKHVCVSDPEGARILCFSEEGEFLTGWHSPGMNLPSGVAFDENCSLWVSDAESDRLLRFETGFCE